MSDDENDRNNNQGNSNQSNASSEINPVKVKLPTFWSNSPETWFIQAEAEFSIGRITSDGSKYNYVVRALPQDIAESISDLLKRRPANDAYEQIKTKLIERHSISIEARIKKLISDEMIGDKKPSEFYRKLLSLAGDCGTVGEDLVKKLWLGRLPNVVSIALIPQSKAEIQDLLKVADQIHEAVQGSDVSAMGFNNNRSSFQSYNQNSNSFSNPLSIESLHAEISELKRTIKEFTNNGNRSRSRTRSYSQRSHSPAPFRQRSKSRKNYDPNGSYCWYHFKFGNKCNKPCNRPCTFNSRNPNSQPSVNFQQSNSKN